MALYANLRDYRFSEDVEDIRGSNLYGIDNEKLGVIDDVIFDNSTGDVRYLVVDSGGWLTSKRFLVPAREVMTDIEGKDRNYRVALRKEHVETLPAYREEILERDEDWKSYERQYDEAYRLVADPVLHIEGTTHIVTPADLPSSAGSETHRVESPRRIAQDMPRFGATSDSESSTHTGKLAADDRPLQPSSTLRPGDVSKSPDFAGGKESNEEIHRTAERIAKEGEGRTESEPVTMDRSEFLKDGTLRSEYDAPREENFVDREPASVANPADISGYAPDGGKRFRQFQERLRRDRELIMRHRNEPRKAA